MFNVHPSIHHRRQGRGRAAITHLLQIFMYTRQMRAGLLMCRLSRRIERGKEDQVTFLIFFLVDFQFEKSDNEILRTKQQDGE